jgi:hypothetical protein
MVEEKWDIACELRGAEVETRRVQVAVGDILRITVWGKLLFRRRDLYRLISSAMMRGVYVPSKVVAVVGRAPQGWRLLNHAGHVMA